MMLFVYGTLDPRHASTAVMGIVRRLRFVASATIAAKLYSLGPYPGVILSADQNTRVHGRVGEAPDDAAFWRAIDDYEGVPEGLYRRVRTSALGEDGRLYEVQVYEYAQSLDRATLIESGIWQT